MTDDDELPVYPLPLGRRHRGDWVPLHVDRLLGSGWAATVDPAAGFHGVLLWAEAVRQDPAGTLPEDDRQLARLAGLGRDVEAWARVRDGALYGWTRVLCLEGEAGDGREVVRLAHPVVTEMVEESLRRLDGKREESRRGAERSRRSRLRKVMSRAGLSAAFTARDDIVDAIRAELAARGEEWRVPAVKAAAERVQLMLDARERASVVSMERARSRGEDG